MSNARVMCVALGGGKIKRGILLFGAVAVVLFLSGTASATIWHVHPDSAVNSIQAGIDSSSHGDTVLVYPEMYVENINFKGKNLVVGSLFLTTGDASYISSTIIDGESLGSVVTFANGEDSTAVITGFTIQNGYARYGGGIYCDNSSPSLANVTISGNTAEYVGGGIYCRSSNSSLVNSTLWDDAPQEVYFDSLHNPNSITIRYSDIQGDSAGIVTNNNGTVFWLEGNIDEDPLFMGTGDHPFALSEGSPCIDAGTPDTAGLNLPPWDIIGNQRIWDGDENGSAVIDMGAYEYGAPPYVGINDRIIAEPKTRSFLQNYPNPFSRHTTIQYTLAKESRVTLKVYNVLGQEVRALVDKFQDAGAYSVVWDSRDNVGRRVSCGTYFLRLEAGDYTATRKLSVMR